MKRLIWLLLGVLPLLSHGQVARRVSYAGAWSNQPASTSVTLSAFANTPDYQNGTQVAKRISDSLTNAAILVTGGLQLNGKTLSLAPPTGTTAVAFDAVPTPNSSNAISSGAVYAALQAYAKQAHTQTASTILDFGPAILAWMQAQSGFGSGTVFGNNGTWVSATGGTALTQLTATTLTAAGTSPTDSKLTLTWPSVPSALTYVVEQAIDAQFQNGLYAAYTGSALTFTQSNLSAGTPYFYRIKAKASGFADSDYAFATLTTTGTAVPTLATPTVTAGTATTNTVAFSWNAPANVQSYSVTFATNSALTAGASSFTTTTTSYSATGLASSTTYYLGVQALATGYTSSGTGTASLATSASVTPGASTTALGTTTLAFSSVTATSANTSWSAIANASTYVLQRATDNAFSANLTSVTLASGTTTYSFTGLTASTAYYARIKGGGGGNYTDGAYSTVASFTTAASSATVSGGGSTTALAATGTVYANGVTTTSIAVSWTNVANVNNANGTSYQTDISTSSSFASILSSVNSATTSTASFTGLSPATAYYVRVKPVGSGNYTDGAYSATVSLTTSAANGTYAVERTVKVNFSTNSNQTAVSTWNTLAPPLASITSGYSTTANFVDATGASTPFGLSIVSGFSGGGVNNFGGVANIPVSVWPAQVLQRAWNYGSGAGTIRLSGLQTNKVYQIYVLSTGTTNTYYGTLTVTGATSQVAGVKYLVNNGTYSAADELSGPGLMVANNVVATANGTVDLVFGMAGTGLSTRPVVGFELIESSVNK